MIRIDPMQFSKENKMLFQEGSWYIFLDLVDFTKNTTDYYPRLAHRCDLVERMKHGKPYEWTERRSCCLMVIDNQVCRDCGAAIPEVFQGFFNLAKWSWE